MHFEKSLYKLSKELTNLIDSNKTISRPSTVVKELIENSLDAESNTISVTIKQGGLALIQVSDNGKGIEKESFNKLCSRFNSSKMSDYAQIGNISTYGFRGEALSIISYISTITITSRTKNHKQAYQATFQNGAFLLSNSNQEWEKNLLYVNGEIGTTIKIENLFYNNMIRKNSYDSSVERSIILELMQYFVVHFSEKNFNLKDLNSSSNFLLNTYPITSSNFKNLNNYEENNEISNRKLLISTLFNKEIVNNLAIFSNEIEFLGINYSCYCSKPSTNLTKSILILFINNRLVINEKIKKVLDYVYSKFLIKHGYYFVYLSIFIKSDEIDVNVKGNKQEVYFLNEDSFIEDFKLELEKNLCIEINSKNYYVGEYNKSKIMNQDEELYSSIKESEKLYAKDIIRVDSKVVSIESFLKNQKYVQKEKASYHPTNNDVLEILIEQNYVKNINEAKTKILKDSFFVGYENEKKIVFFQHQTQEYIIYKLLKRDFQTVIIDTGNSLLLENLIEFVNNTYNLFENKLEVDDENIKNYCSIIHENKEILDILSIKYDDNFFIKTIPFVFSDSISQESITSFDDYLPILIYSILYHLKFLSQETKKIENLFEIIKIIAFYIKQFLLNQDSLDKEYFIKNVIFAEIKTSNFVLRNSLKIDMLIEKLVDTESLYNIFERC